MAFRAMRSKTRKRFGWTPSSERSPHIRIPFCTLQDTTRSCNHTRFSRKTGSELKRGTWPEWVVLDTGESVWVQAWSSAEVSFGACRRRIAITRMPIISEATRVSRSPYEKPAPFPLITGLGSIRRVRGRYWCHCWRLLWDGKRK